MTAANFEVDQNKLWWILNLLDSKIRCLTLRLNKHDIAYKNLYFCLSYII